MLFKICGVEVMELMKEVDYTRENGKLHMEIMDVNKVSHNFIKNQFNNKVLRNKMFIL